jgi:hypothetical protein
MGMAKVLSSMMIPVTRPTASNPFTNIHMRKDPTDVGQKVGMSRNGVNRPTDKPGPQNRIPGQSQICLCIVESNVAEWTTVHGAVRFLIS